METTTPTPPTSSGDGSSTPTASEKMSGATEAHPGETSDLLRADGSLIPVTREEGEAPRREPTTRSALLAWRSRAAERLAAAAPSEIALSAFVAGLVAGVILGAAHARR
jgi:hypothetical protein